MAPKVLTRLESHHKANSFGLLAGAAALNVKARRTEEKEAEEKKQQMHGMTIWRRMFEILKILIWLCTRAFGYLDFITDFYVLRASASLGVIWLTVCLALSLIGPFLISYSSGLAIFTRLGWFENLSGFRTIFAILLVSPFGLLYFLAIEIIEYAFLLNDLFSMLFFSGSIRTLVIRRMEYARWLGLTPMSWEGLKRQRTMVQLCFESAPQLILQCLAAYWTRMRTSNTIYISILLAALNLSVNLIRLYLESQACRESMVTYTRACLNARTDWFPFKRILIALAADTQLPRAASSSSSRRTDFSTAFDTLRRVLSDSSVMRSDRSGTMTATVSATEMNDDDPRNNQRSQREDITLDFSRLIVLNFCDIFRMRLDYYFNRETLSELTAIISLFPRQASADVSDEWTAFYNPSGGTTHSLRRMETITDSTNVTLIIGKSLDLVPLDSMLEFLCACDGRVRLADFDSKAGWIDKCLELSGDPRLPEHATVKDEPLLQVLIESGVDHTHHSMDLPIFTKFVRMGINVNFVWNDRALLHFVVETGRNHYLDRILTLFAQQKTVKLTKMVLDINVHSPGGMSPLMYAVQLYCGSASKIIGHSSSKGGLSLFDSKSANNANHNHNNNHLDSSSMSDIQKNRLFESIQLLVEFGANVNFEFAGRSCLSIAFQKCEFDLARYLLGHRAHVGKMEVQALCRGIIKQLEKGVSFQQVWKHVQSTAAMVLPPLKLSPSLMTDSNGNTPLHLLCVYASDRKGDGFTSSLYLSNPRRGSVRPHHNHHHNHHHYHMAGDMERPLLGALNSILSRVKCWNTQKNKDGKTYIDVLIDGHCEAHLALALGRYKLSEVPTLHPKAYQKLKAWSVIVKNKRNKELFQALLAYQKSEALRKRREQKKKANQRRQGASPKGSGPSSSSSSSSASSTKTDSRNTMTAFNKATKKKSTAMMRPDFTDGITMTAILRANTKVPTAMGFGRSGAPQIRGGLKSRSITASSLAAGSGGRQSNILPPISDRPVTSTAMSLSKADRKHAQLRSLDDFAMSESLMEQSYVEHSLTNNRTVFIDKKSTLLGGAETDSESDFDSDDDGYGDLLSENDELNRMLMMDDDDDEDDADDDPYGVNTSADGGAGGGAGSSSASSNRNANGNANGRRRRAQNLGQKSDVEWVTALFSTAAEVLALFDLFGDIIVCSILIRADQQVWSALMIVSMVAPFLVCYSASLPVLPKITALASTPLCLLYFLLLDAVFICLQISWILMALLCIKTRRMRDWMDALLRYSFKLSHMQASGLQRCRSLAQLMFETIPQILLQLRILFYLRFEFNNQNNQNQNNNNNLNEKLQDLGAMRTILFSLFFSMLHLMIESASLNLECRALQINIWRYILICLSGRVLWIPFVQYLNEKDLSNQIYDFETIVAWIDIFQYRFFYRLEYTFDDLSLPKLGSLIRYNCPLHSRPSCNLPTVILGERCLSDVSDKSLRAFLKLVKLRVNVAAKDEAGWRRILLISNDANLRRYESRKRLLNRVEHLIYSGQADGVKAARCLTKDLTHPIFTGRVFDLRREMCQSQSFVVCRHFRECGLRMESTELFETVRDLTLFVRRGIDGIQSRIEIFDRRQECAAGLEIIRYLLHLVILNDSFQRIWTELTGFTFDDEVAVVFHGNHTNLNVKNDDTNTTIVNKISEVLIPWRMALRFAKIRRAAEEIGSLPDSSNQWPTLKIQRRKGRTHHHYKKREEKKNADDDSDDDDRDGGGAGAGAGNGNDPHRLVLHVECPKKWNEPQVCCSAMTRLLDLMTNSVKYSVKSMVMFEKLVQHFGMDVGLNQYYHLTKTSRIMRVCSETRRNIPVFSSLFDEHNRMGESGWLHHFNNSHYSGYNSDHLMQGNNNHNNNRSTSEDGMTFLMARMPLKRLSKDINYAALVALTIKVGVFITEDEEEESKHDGALTVDHQNSSGIQRGQLKSQESMKVLQRWKSVEEAKEAMKDAKPTLELLLCDGLNSVELENCEVDSEEVSDMKGGLCTMKLSFLQDNSSLMVDFLPKYIQISLMNFASDTHLSVDCEVKCSYLTHKFSSKRKAEKNVGIIMYGCGASGQSTLFRHIQQIYGNSLSDSANKAKLLMLIRLNTIEYCQKLIEVAADYSEQLLDDTVDHDQQQHHHHHHPHSILGFSMGEKTLKPGATAAISDDVMVMSSEEDDGASAADHAGDDDDDADAEDDDGDPMIQGTGFDYSFDNIDQRLQSDAKGQSSSAISIASCVPDLKNDALTLELLEFFQDNLMDPSKRVEFIEQVTPRLRFAQLLEACWFERDWMRNCFESRFNRFAMDENAPQFIGSATDFFDEDFEPTPQQILLSHEKTDRISKFDFAAGKEYILADMPSKYGKAYLSEANVVLFVASLTLYSEIGSTHEFENAQMESLKMFRKLVSREDLKKARIMVVLTKKDEFADRIQKVPLMDEDESEQQEQMDYTDEENAINFVIGKYRAIWNRDPSEFAVRVVCSLDQSDVSELMKDVILMHSAQQS